MIQITIATAEGGEPRATEASIDDIAQAKSILHKIGGTFAEA